MTVTEAPAPSRDLVRAAAAAVRDSGALGRSATLLRLFDFLVTASLEGRSPKESEIAIEVFGMSPGAVGEDAAVRVYVHRLRQKLDEHARRLPVGAPALALPKGAYRIALVSEAPAPDASRRLSRIRTLSPSRLALAALVAGALAIGAWGAAAAWNTPASALRRDPLWGPFATGARPLVLVVGDYYIFGESDDGMEVSRLIREYQVNSPEDLANFAAQTPDRPERYVDLGLHYLPTSSAAAVARFAALFGAAKPPRILPASQLTPDLLKTSDIIYVGYLSGLGPLRDAAFAGSRYDVGDSFDELTERATRRRFVSQGAYGPARGGGYRDYGYVARFDGPAGNHIAIVAGERDIGALGAAEQATQARPSKALVDAARHGKPFEALFEVSGEGSVDFRTRLVTADGRGAPER